jgi:hypothetical protein
MSNIEEALRIINSNELLNELLNQVNESHELGFSNKHALKFEIFKLTKILLEFFNGALKHKNPFLRRFKKLSEYVQLDESIYIHVYESRKQIVKIRISVHSPIKQNIINEIIRRLYNYLIIDISNYLKIRKYPEIAWEIKNAINSYSLPTDVNVDYIYIADRNITIVNKIISEISKYLLDENFANLISNNTKIVWSSSLI